MEKLNRYMKEHAEIRSVLAEAQAITEGFKATKVLDCIAVEKVADYFLNDIAMRHFPDEEENYFALLADHNSGETTWLLSIIVGEHETAKSLALAICALLPMVRKADRMASKLLCENIQGYIGLMQGHLLKEENNLYILAEKILDEDEFALINR